MDAMVDYTLVNNPSAAAFVYIVRTYSTVHVGHTACLAHLMHTVFPHTAPRNTKFLPHRTVAAARAGSIAVYRAQTDRFASTNIAVKGDSYIAETLETDFFSDEAVLSDAELTLGEPSSDEDDHPPPKRFRPITPNPDSTV